MSRLIQLSPETLQVLRSIRGDTYFFDRLTKRGELEVTESMFRELQARTPLGKTIDSTILQLVKGPRTC